MSELPKSTDFGFPENPCPTGILVTAYPNSFDPSDFEHLKEFLGKKLFNPRGHCSIPEVIVQSQRSTLKMGVEL